MSNVLLPITTSADLQIRSSRISFLYSEAGKVSVHYNMSTMKSLAASIVLCFLLPIPGSNSLKAGDFFTICKRSSPNFDDCVNSATNEGIRKLKNGNPELKLPSIDPLIIPMINIQQGSGPVAINSTFTNTELIGCSNYISTNSRLDYGAKIFYGKGIIPSLQAKGNYTMVGKILLLPIVGSGYSSSNYTDMELTTSVTFQSYNKKGKEYWKVKDMEGDISVKKANIHLGNLFDGNKQLGDSMNQFIAENWKEVFQELKPFILEALKIIHIQEISKIFRKFSIDQLVLN